MDFSKIVFTVNNTQVEVAPSAEAFYTSDKWFEHAISTYTQMLGRPVSLSYVKYMDRLTFKKAEVMSASRERRAHQRRLLRLKRKLKLLVS